MSTKIWPTTDNHEREIEKFKDDLRHDAVRNVSTRFPDIFVYDVLGQKKFLNYYSISDGTTLTHNLEAYLYRATNQQAAIIDSNDELALARLHRLCANPIWGQVMTFSDCAPLAREFVPVGRSNPFVSLLPNMPANQVKIYVGPKIYDLEGFTYYDSLADLDKLPAHSCNCLCLYDAINECAPHTIFARINRVLVHGGTFIVSNWTANTGLDALFVDIHCDTFGLPRPKHYFNHNFIHFIFARPSLGSHAYRIGTKKGAVEHFIYRTHPILRYTYIYHKPNIYEKVRQHIDWHYDGQKYYETMPKGRFRVTYIPSWATFYANDNFKFARLFSILDESAKIALITKLRSASGNPYTKTVVQTNDGTTADEELFRDIGPPSHNGRPIKVKKLEHFVSVGAKMSARIGIKFPQNTYYETRFLAICCPGEEWQWNKFITYMDFDKFAAHVPWCGPSTPLTLPYENASFDFITTFNVLSRFTAEYCLALIKEIDRVLAPGGLFILKERFVTHVTDALAHEILFNYYKYHGSPIMIERAPFRNSLTHHSNLAAMLPTNFKILARTDNSEFFAQTKVHKYFIYRIYVKAK